MSTNFYWIIFPREINGYQQIRGGMRGGNSAMVKRGMGL
jgi:hypothetical protein